MSIIMAAELSGDALQVIVDGVVAKLWESPAGSTAPTEDPSDREMSEHTAGEYNLMSVKGCSFSTPSGVKLKRVAQCQTT